MKNNNKNQDLVTIVTVTYNAEDLLEETILSILNQSYKNIEYIIIDGASNDGTIDIIKKDENKINYWRSEPDEGIYYAMNKAIEKATGKWINFMNAGDTFFNIDTISNIIRHKDEDSKLVYGNCQIDSRINKPHDLSRYDNITSICHQTVFVRTDLMKNTPFDTKYKISADHDFILKMFQNKKKFQYLDEPIANYLLNGLSDTESLRLYIEGINILFTNNVPENDILISPWYKDLKKSISTTKENHTNVLQEEINNKEKIIQEKELQSKQLFTLLNSVQTITSYSVWKQPLKKYKAYQSMLRTYENLKESGDK